MIRRLFLLPVLAAALSGCSPKPAESQPMAHLPAGTRVELALATPLEAGKQSEGDLVDLVVAKPVAASNGRVLIAEGARAQGKVAWSRNEGTLSGLMRQPARLAIELEGVDAVDGRRVTISADQGGKKDARFDFDRENTSRSAVNLDPVWQDQALRDALSKAAEALASGNSDELDQVPADTLRRAVEQLGLRQAEAQLKSDSDGTLRALKSLASGKGLAEAALGGQPLAVLKGVGELVGLLDDTANRLGRMLKGRTIKAPLGMRITGYVAEGVDVKADR